ncbi:hypothetical protein S40285_00908 [Stachybotrys chlorohalonatus IBT 40285]|jgi:GAF domain-containing protein|uniref:Uncharacterized protein n=1 Tax=Stachybotrys chlorohalonatus (strain IBT 40285) TaxID=1283841 RepID=A0A084QUS9_STAC4|nr:hypothetical protein S40285_00908 [Stachybotrys chlorohalonata IBT 40285]
MPLFSKSSHPVDSADPNHGGEKPLSEPRPGTSGTEALLVSNRRQASHQFQRAQRVERAYRARKRATAARRDYQVARDHFKEALRHMREGLVVVGRCARALPYVVGEKKRQRALARKKRLEEKLARETGEEEREREDGEEDGEEERPERAG